MQWFWNVKTGEISELSLAAIIAVATLLGGVLSSIVSSLVIDASTERQTDIQLVQLAIGILSTPLSDSTPEARGWTVEAMPPRTSQTALREWAVDTINQSAEVKFDDEARTLLINGQAFFPDRLVEGALMYEQLKAAVEAVAEAIRSGAEPPASHVEVRPIVREDRTE